MITNYQERMKELDKQIEACRQRQAIAAKLGIFFYGVAAVFFIVGLICGEK